LISRNHARRIAFLLVMGSAWAGSAEIARSSAKGPGAAVAEPKWIDVPFVRQPRDGCGAASIAMVMQYWEAQQKARPGTRSDVDASNVEAIERELHLPHRQGIGAEQMETYLRRHGFDVYPLNGSWNDLEEQIGKGRPVIAALKPSGQSELHYIVIDGVDGAHGLVTVNDPAERKLLTRERAGFEREWGATHNWMLLALPARAAH
jgi:ABC-type bacteriocin/lantibiotic exporter with double-glycine peptidase domain